MQPEFSNKGKGLVPPSYDKSPEVVYFQNSKAPPISSTPFAPALEFCELWSSDSEIKVSVTESSFLLKKIKWESRIPHFSWDAVPRRTTHWSADDNFRPFLQCLCLLPHASSTINCNRAQVIGLPKALAFSVDLKAEWFTKHWEENNSQPRKKLMLSLIAGERNCKNRHFFICKSSFINKHFHTFICHLPVTNSHAQGEIQIKHYSTSPYHVQNTGGHKNRIQILIYCTPISDDTHKQVGQTVVKKKAKKKLA